MGIDQDAIFLITEIDGKKEREYVFRNPKLLTEWICWVCYVGIFLLVMDFFITAGAISSELIIVVVSALMAAFAVVPGVLILIWMYRPNANAH